MQKNFLESKQIESESLNTITGVHRPRQTKLSDCILEEIENDDDSLESLNNNKKQVHFDSTFQIQQQNDTQSATSSNKTTNLICLKLPIKMPNLMHKSKQNDKPQKESLSSLALIESSNQLPLEETTSINTNACKSTHNSNYTNRFRSVVFRLFRRHFNNQQNSDTNHCCCYIETNRKTSFKNKNQKIETENLVNTKIELNLKKMSLNELSKQQTDEHATIASTTTVAAATTTITNSFKSKNTALVKPNRVMNKKTTLKQESSKMDSLLLPPMHHHPHHQYSHHTNRRESFLYKTDTDFDNLLVNKKSNRSASITSEQHQEDLIVTPFAQILASLKNVRQNFINLSNLSNEKVDNPTGEYSSKKETNHLKDDSSSRQQHSLETLEELDWCLTQLENMQSHKTISDIASTKFKKMLNKELSHFAEHNKSDNQIAEYICNTYLDKKEEIELPTAKIDQSEQLARIRTSNNNLTKLQPAVNRRSSTVYDLSPPDEASLLQEDKILNKKITSDHIDTSNSTAINQSVLIHNNESNTNSNSKLIQSETPRQVMNNIFTVKYDNSDNKSKEPVSRYDIEIKKNNELENAMNDIDKWGIDIFLIDELTLHRPLTAVVYNIFQKREIMKTFSISPDTLINYLTVLEDNYQPVPYHNKIHAADVTQSMHVLLNSKALESVFTDLEIFAAIFSAAIHDVDHPGLTNQYLINTGSELALMYNDESVLENHHLAIAFKLLQNESHDIFFNLGKKQRQIIRKMIIDMVLATDMSKHMSLLAELKTMVESKKVSGSGFIVLESYQDRIRVLQNMLHCADLSNPTKPLHIYQNWIDRVMGEFYLQGDRELSEGLEISPMCDRHNASVEKSQVGFIDFIVHPLWESWSDLVAPDAQEILDALEQNRNWYCTQVDKANSNSNNNNSNSKSSSSNEEEIN